MTSQRLLRCNRIGGFRLDALNGSGPVVFGKIFRFFPISRIERGGSCAGFADISAFADDADGTRLLYRGTVGRNAGDSAGSPLPMICETSRATSMPAPSSLLPGTPPGVFQS